MVFVTNPPQVVGHRKLLSLFKRFRGVTNAYVPLKRTRLNARFGFVRFDCDEVTRLAILNANGLTWRDKVLHVKKATFGRIFLGQHPRKEELDRGLPRKKGGCFL
ncbi:hypothetical protein Dimus_025525 [Dionaea muscipula]